jgi:hypothetical protein
LILDLVGSLLAFHSPSAARDDDPERLSLACIFAV